MAINIYSEKYDSNNVLKANAGDWIEGEIEFSATVDHNVTEFNKLYYRDVTGNGGGIYELRISQGDWKNEGFSIGDTIEIEVRLDLIFNGSTYGYDTTKYTGVIANFTSATTLILTGALQPTNVSYPVVPFSVPWTVIEFPGARHYITGNFPRIYEYLTAVVRKVSRPEQIDFSFNLNANGNTSQNSIIDSQVNRFVYELPQTTSFSVYQMQQFGNKSGGWIKDVKIQQLTDSGATTTWKIRFKFFQWGIVQDGFVEPDYYSGINCISPIGNVKVYSKINNPNGILSQNTTNTNADTGGYDEVYNGGINPFNVDFIEWKDNLGNVINGLDYTGESTFRAIIETGGTQTLNHRYRIGLAWRPEDSDYYSNLLTNLGDNLIINAPENLFIANGVIDTNTYLGNSNNSGAKWDLTNLKFEITGTKLEVTGKVVPNQQCENLFSTILDGGRRSTLWIALGTDVNIDGGGNKLLPIKNRVSLKLSDTDNIDAPIVGVQIPNVISQTLLDHNGNNITNNSVDNTTTEDDILYKSEFLLVDNIQYEGLKAVISAFNHVTNESFELESFYFDFSNVVNQNGQFQPNITLQRSFNLPPTTDRNIVSLKRKSSLDVSGKYGIELQYGFLNDWRYWLSQLNVNNDFFDITQPYNGKNKNWQRFYSGRWTLRLSYYTTVNDVEDYNHYIFKIRPYEDDADVSTSVNFTVLSNGTTPNELVKDELIEIEATFTWDENFDDEWVEFTVEDFEAGNRWVISSVLEQGNIGINPLKPTTGNTKIEVAGTGTNILVCKALIDTSLISSNKVSLGFRVYSAPNESGEITEETKLTEDGSVKLTENNLIKIIE